MVIHFYLVYVRHFLNTFLYFVPFWRRLWLRALSSRLVRLMVAPYSDPLLRTSAMDEGIFRCAGIRHSAYGKALNKIEI